jgi:hypothetical protein
LEPKSDEEEDEAEEEEEPAERPAPRERSAPRSGGKARGRGRGQKPSEHPGGSYHEYDDNWTRPGEEHLPHVPAAVLRDRRLAFEPSAFTAKQLSELYQGRKNKSFITYVGQGRHQDGLVRVNAKVNPADTWIKYPVCWADYRKTTYVEYRDSPGSWQMVEERVAIDEGVELPYGNCTKAVIFALPPRYDVHGQAYLAHLDLASETKCRRAMTRAEARAYTTAVGGVYEHDHALWRALARYKGSRSLLPPSSLHVAVIAFACVFSSLAMLCVTRIHPDVVDLYQQVQAVKDLSLLAIDVGSLPSSPSRVSDHVYTICEELINEGIPVCLFGSRKAHQWYDRNIRGITQLIDPVTGSRFG